MCISNVLSSLQVLFGLGAGIFYSQSNERTQSWIAFEITFDINCGRLIYDNAVTQQCDTLLLSCVYTENNNLIFTVVEISNRI